MDNGQLLNSDWESGLDMSGLIQPLSTWQNFCIAVIRLKVKTAHCAPPQKFWLDTYELDTLEKPSSPYNTRCLCPTMPHRFRWYTTEPLCIDTNYNHDLWPVMRKCNGVFFDGRVPIVQIRFQYASSEAACNAGLEVLTLLPCHTATAGKRSYYATLTQSEDKLGPT